MALITVPGAANANSYASVADADAYHEGHVAGADWFDGDEDLKEPALEQATRMLDAYLEWTEGYVVTSTQRLLWPRTGALGKNGWYLDATTIPREVVDATSEFARQLLAADRSADSAVQTQGLTSVKAGSVELAFDAAAVSAKPIPDAVYYLVQHLCHVKVRPGTGSSGGISTVSLVRV